MAGDTLFHKIWKQHVIADLGDGYALLHVDRHMLHELGARSLVGLRKRGLPLHDPKLTFATADHCISTDPADVGEAQLALNPYVQNIRQGARELGFRLFDVGTPGFGIVHVIAPELAVALPGITMACGDSHTCTIGALGAIAWGVGQSELVHILATQASAQKLPKTMRLSIEGSVAPHVTAKDITLWVMSEVGADGALDHAVEFAGPVVRAMSMEERFTLCNMSVEMGGRFGLIAPDETTFEYLQGRRFAPRGVDWDEALRQWRDLHTEVDAVFDKEVRMDVSDAVPCVTWGTSPDQVVGIDGCVPDPDAEPDPVRRRAIKTALDYVGLSAGAPIAGTKVDQVFIGSCTNARLSDLELAARYLKGRRVAAHVEAWVVPGSREVKLQAEAAGLDKLLREAGFQWREAGCSMCGGMGNLYQERVRPGARAVSTTNRNYVGRQGPGSRTHLAGPPMAVAAAIAGCISDVRDL
jgi:3-isopropylmalate/(R)-2-methylmalate dehydratase large subunit